MAFSNSTSDRMDELRFRSQQSPRNESSMSFAALTSPIRTGRLPPPSSTHDGGRMNLTRRFTTDSGRVPTITSIASQRTIQALESLDFPPSNYHKVQLLEKKKIEYERLREQKRRFESEMRLLELQQQREEQELQQMEVEIRTSTSSSKTQNGHQSEPTTPPEYRETSSGFPSVFSRPNRYSTSSITSPPGLYNRPGRSGSQLTSPQSGIMPSRHILDEMFSPHSGPISRHGSDDDDDKQEAVRQDPTSYRSSNTSNRYSMPVTKSRNKLQDMMMDSEQDLDQSSTTEFLFRDDEPSKHNSSFLEKSSTQENFPFVLHRTGQQSTGQQQMNLSALPLDLTSSASPEPHPYPPPFGPFHSQRPSFSKNHPPTAQALGFQDYQGSTAPKSTVQSNNSAGINQTGHHMYSRPSVDMGYPDEHDGLTGLASPKHIQANAPKLQSSLSANDVPTMKNGSGDARNYGMSHMMSPPNQYAQQHSIQHNANMGRYPANGVNNRHSRELSGGGDTIGLRESHGNGMPSIQSALHASAPPFNIHQPRLQQPHSPQGNSSSGYAQYQNQNPYSTYDGNYVPNLSGMQMLTGAMQNMQMGQQIPDMRMAQSSYNPTSNFNNSPLFPNYNAYPQSTMQHHGGQNNGYGRGHDSQARVIESRRKQDQDKMAKYQGQTVQSMAGKIFEACKDQHGCRHLQTMIDGRNPADVHAIWVETADHIVELMMDPFGNYLCQKLFELCQDSERTILIENAAKGSNMFNIAISTHGTRALQKMIEHAQTSEQITIIIGALQSRVVELIQDLNGNHVIQKCLTKFTPTDSQFIFDAVAQQSVEVGTHRHGCCVLQRCIDHAKDEQKANLIHAITTHAKRLVQDPFGNYVIQYILDLNEDVYTDAIVMTFKDQIESLSAQKYSSNVIEKCIRTASEDSKKMIFDELVQPNVLRVISTDSYGNYVVQTALKHANPDVHLQLVAALQQIGVHLDKHPYGKKVKAKMEKLESGTTTPDEGGQILLPRLGQHNRGNSSNAHYAVATNGFSRNAGFQHPRQNGNGAASNGYQGRGHHGHQDQSSAYRGSDYGEPSARPGWL